MFVLEEHHGTTTKNLLSSLFFSFHIRILHCVFVSEICSSWDMVWFDISSCFWLTIYYAICSSIIFSSKICFWLVWKIQHFKSMFRLDDCSTHATIAQRMQNKVSFHASCMDLTDLFACQYSNDATSCGGEQRNHQVSTFSTRSDLC